MNKEVIQRIEAPYVANNCVQLAFRYTKALTIIKGISYRKEENQIIFHHDVTEDNSKYINEYTNDKRKDQFPYSTMPIYIEKTLFKTYNVVNQILDYNYIYQIIKEDEERTVITFLKVIRDKNNAIVIQDTELGYIFCMSANELKHLNITKALEPNIKTSYNKEFSSEEIKKQKKLARKLKRKSKK